MKSLVIRYEDRAAPRPQAVGLLAAARLSVLQELAKTGIVGLVSQKARAARRVGRAIVRGLPAHWSWVGYTQAEVPSWAGGSCYAASTHQSPEAGHLVWCCDFVTQHDGRLMDAEAGRISTTEAVSLIQALNETLGATDRRWRVGEGSHHLLLSGDAKAFETWRAARIHPPHQLLGRRWHAELPRGPLGGWLREVLEGAAAVLERHAVNRVRLDLGENPANLVWLWGPSAGEPIPSWPSRVGGSGAIVARDFALRGLAELIGAAWVEAPGRVDETGLRRLSRLVADALTAHQVVYVVVPVETSNPVERQCLMERADRYLHKPLADHLKPLGQFRCLIAIEDHPSQTTPFVALGPEAEASGTVSLSHQAAAKTGVLFEDGASAFAWFMGTMRPVVPSTGAGRAAGVQAGPTMGLSLT